MDNQEAEQVHTAAIRFAGDSGDGMQLAGARFTDASAIFGNDLSTFANFPAEIRAPAGTLPGVSSFQVHIADRDILTPGDQPDVLVAMNPAALKANISDLAPAGIIIVNTDAFDERNLARAGYATNPIEDGSLDAYRILKVPMEDLTKRALEGSGVKGRDALRSKNFFAVGLMTWMFQRPLEPTLEWIASKFASEPNIKAANELAFRAGFNLGETTEMFRHTYRVQPARLPAGTYTNVTGNQALAWGIMAAGQAARLPVFYASYPITPASDILHELSRHRNFGVRTFQAEDEIAAAGAALGASFAGHLGVTATSGPGLALKSETISLALMTELPLLIIDVQRGGPSTGLPTKTEQADLLMAMYGRHGESPLPIVSISTPADAFDATIEAARIAIKYMTPVILLSDGYIGTSTEPWRLPDLAELPDISVPFAMAPNGPDATFLPYLRDARTQARPWAVPGTPGLEHRLGGLEKDGTGNVSYAPENHERMTLLREGKVKGIAADIPDAFVDADAGAEVLVVGWGSSYGAILAGIRRVRAKGRKVARIHLRHLNPFPANLGAALEGYRKVLVPELNRGQLVRMIRAEFLVDAISYPKVQGQPFKAAEIEAKLMEVLG
ncbi:MAG: 2-oxoglutarate ferredoxin oxidoreductase subunit alpha [Actinobacteria bacterium RBG_16_67_15]|nr:MAG: 2-oxoglutarate ferredoxin oxidoreductase subunit alpha [Actinobacteria bacterium RBG_16_67_15]